VVEGYSFTEDRLQSYISFVGKVFPEAVLNGYSPDTRPVELILLRQKNCGPSATRNLGIQHSKGDWVAFLDADDLWTPMAIESLLRMTCDYPQSSFVFGDGLNFSESGETLEKVSSHFDDFPNGQIDGAFEYFAKGNPILNGAVLVLKETILKAGGFREDVSHGEDYDLWLKLALFTQVACTDGVVMLRRRRSGALSENQEAFYKAGSSIFTEIKKEHVDLLISQEIYIGKHISTARYKLAYFYYVNGMYLKATLATVRWAWGRFTSLLERVGHSGLQNGK
jgi:glycosyltransferase involved in cell wall biosynthesis